MSDNYSHNSRKSRHARRKARKPRPQSERLGPVSRSRRRAGTKAKHIPGSATWCQARGLPAWGEGKNNKRRGKR